MNVQKYDQYLVPENLAELYSLTAKWGNRARIIAGGTDLLVRMKQRTCKPEALISLKKVNDLKTIASVDDGICIGSAVKLSDLISSTVIREDYPVLVEAASKVGAYQHQTMGTIGGNLCQETRCIYINQSDFLRESLSPCLKAEGKICHVVKGQKCFAVYSSDTAPALLALGARVHIGSVTGERWDELSGLFSGDGLNPISLKEGEVLTGIFVNQATATAGGVYLKLAERSFIDFPCLGVAASITLSDDNTCKRAGLAITAAGSAPFLVEEAKNLVGEEQLSDASLESILEETNKRAVIVKNKALNIGYHRTTLKKMVRAALEIAWEKAEGHKGGYSCHE